ncbi:MAG: hypothetical protein JO041_04250 [Acidobacteria bacterium]|nr:hypothetical protein [Acidobacteriota bacterium]
MPSAERELGFLYSGDLTPVSGVYKGVHRCGRTCCYFVTSAESRLPACVDCGLIRFSLFAISPSADQPASPLQLLAAMRFR